MLRILIEAGGTALLTLKTPSGESCADIARKEGNTEVLRVLQEMSGEGEGGHSGQ